jgi:hypothetical protein
VTSDQEPVLAGLPPEAQPGGLDAPASSFSSTPSTDEALTLVREAMASATGLLPVTEAAALAIAALTSAWEVTISLIDGSEYWDIVDVCREPDGWPRFPNFRYPLSDYPVGTERMLSGKGYTSGNAADEVMKEIERQWPEVPISSIMSAPIIALGGVHGEIFLVRDASVPPFNRDELDVVSEVATLLGARLPALVSNYLDSLDTSDAAESMPTLTHQLREMLDVPE